MNNIPTPYQAGLQHGEDEAIALCDALKESKNPDGKLLSQCILRLANACASTPDNCAEDDFLHGTTDGFFAGVELALHLAMRGQS